MTIPLTCCIALGLLGTSFLRAGIAVDFPPTADEKAPVLLTLPSWHEKRGKSVPYYKEGKLIFFSVMGGANVAGHSIENLTFDKVKEGMTLNEIVSLLGPGTLDSLQGVASVCWKSEDGRFLSLERVGGIDETAKFTITQRGENERHGEVKQLAEKLISSIEIADRTVRVTLTEDAPQAKAMEAKTYRIDEMFQRIEPLPRIDFTITQIEGDQVHCRYFYQPLPEGVFQYSETGSIILTPAGDGGTRLPSPEVDLKVDDVGK